MGSWTNNDGMKIKYGPEEVIPSRAGEYNLLGSQHMVEVALDLTEISASAQTILSDNVIIPDNCRLEKVEVLVTEVTAGTNSNLDLGLIRLDRSTELDYNGLLAAADAWHEGTIGTITEYVVGTTEAGALIGTVITNPGYLVAKADTAAFTDGTLTIRIYYSFDIVDSDS